MSFRAILPLLLVVIREIRTETTESLEDILFDLVLDSEIGSTTEDKPIFRRETTLSTESPGVKPHLFVGDRSAQACKTKIEELQETVRYQCLVKNTNCAFLGFLSRMINNKQNELEQLVDAIHAKEDKLKSTSSVADGNQQLHLERKVKQLKEELATKLATYQDAISILSIHDTDKHLPAIRPFKRSASTQLNSAGDLLLNNEDVGEIEEMIQKKDIEAVTSGFEEIIHPPTDDALPENLIKTDALLDSIRKFFPFMNKAFEKQETLRD